MSDVPPLAEGEPQLPAMPAELSFGLDSMIEEVGTFERPSTIAILGRYKSGKSVLAASAYEISGLRAAGKDVLFIEAEKGTSSIGEFYPKVKKFPLPGQQGPFAMFQAFEYAMNELLTKPHNYGVVVIDTFDKVQEAAVEWFLAQNAGDTRSGYREVKTWTNKVAWNFHYARFLVIFLVHETDNKDERSGLWKNDFALAGSAKDTIGQVFDIIGQLTAKTDPATGKTIRTLQVGIKEGTVTGNRYESKLPSSIDNPTLPQIFEMLEAPSNAEPKNEGN